MRSALLAAVLALAPAAVRPAPGIPQERLPARVEALRVSGTGRLLETRVGGRFFYLADSAWPIVHCATREDVEWYLAARASQKFTVIHAAVMAPTPGSCSPDVRDATPFAAGDPSTPNERFFGRVDRLVHTAAAHGMYVTLLPAGDEHVSGETDHLRLDAGRARQYGRYLGARYRDTPNVIWMLAGERASGTEGVWQALADGLRAGNGGAVPKLIGLRRDLPATSNAGAFDFLVVRSGPTNRWPHAILAAAYAQRPVKPALNGEAGYEAAATGGVPGDRLLNEEQARRAAYWSVFEGAFGHAYAAYEIATMQVSTPGAGGAGPAWRGAVRRPAAEQMRHLRALVDRADRVAREPAPDLLGEAPLNGPLHVGVLAGRDRSWAYVYIPAGAPAPLVRLDRMRVERLGARWYDPRTGNEMESLTVEDLRSPLRAVPPDARDWVLMLEGRP